MAVRKARNKMKFNAIAGTDYYKAGSYEAPTTLGNAPKQDKIANDSAINSMLPIFTGLMYGDGYPQFLGYGILAGLTQNGLIRAGVELQADDMTRKWIKLSRKKKTNDNKIEELESELEKFNVQELFNRAKEISGYYGGCFIFANTGDLDLASPMPLDGRLFTKGKLKGFKLIEPYLCTAGIYNSTMPMQADYYVPKNWWVQGNNIHSSRLIQIKENEVTNLYLPAYNFMGIPLSQIVLDVVKHFTECREASARLLKKFSFTILKTNLTDILEGGAGNEIKKRVDYMVKHRDNDGCEVVDKDQEDIVQINTPLSGVVDIVRQAMDIVSAYFGEPATKLWGMSPAGLNATGEYDMRNHYDKIHSLQEKIFRKPLTQIIKLLQLNLYGEIDNSITFEFVRLDDNNENLDAQTKKLKAEINQIYLDSNVISPDEVRTMLAKQENSGYNDIAENTDADAELVERLRGLVNGKEIENNINQQRGVTEPDKTVTPINKGNE